MRPRYRALVLTTLVLLFSSLPTHGQRKRGEVNTPPARGERHRAKIKVGDVAPDFTLTDLSGKKKVKLSSFRGKRPVVLIFGSYT